MVEQQQSERDFERAADAELRALERALAAVEEAEVDLESGILKLELEGDVTYIVNSHRAARQIWLSAERQAWHFDPTGAPSAWVANKGRDELWATLRSLLEKRLGHPVRLLREEKP